MLHRLGKLFWGQCIEDIIFCKPCPAGLGHSVMDFIQVGGVVRIGVDYDLHAVVLCQA
jgi:hypothetical protein